MTSQHEDVAAAIERVEAACIGSSGSTGGSDHPDAAHDGDGDGWAHRVAFTMLLDDVAETRAVEALDEVASQVEASGEGPRELFGDPDHWVAERRARWREAGKEHVVRPRPSPLDLLGESLFAVAIISGLFLVYLLVTWSWGEPVSLGMLLFPVVIGLLGRVVQLVYTEARVSRSQSLGVLAAVGTTAVGVAATFGVIVLTRDTTLGGPGALWLLGLAVVCAGLGLVLAMLVRERPARPASAPQDPEEWFDALARALREREDVSDARVKEIVAESREHAHQAGTLPQDEFGSPGAYAARFPGSRRLTARRKAWFATALAGLVLVYDIASLADGTPSIWGLLWLVLMVVLAVVEWRAVRRA